MVGKPCLGLQAELLSIFEMRYSKSSRKWDLITKLRQENFRLNSDELFLSTFAVEKDGMLYSIVYDKLRSCLVLQG